MRTIEEITDAVQEEGPVTDIELRLALMAIHYNYSINTHSDFDTVNSIRCVIRAKEQFTSRFNLYKLTPDKYLGPNWTPGTPENKDQRDTSKRILRGFKQSQALKTLN